MEKSASKFQRLVNVHNEQDPCGQEFPSRKGTLKVTTAVTSHLATYTRKEESNLILCSREILCQNSSEVVELDESTFEIISWWLGLVKLKDDLKLWDEDHWWPLLVMNYPPRGEGDAFQKASSKLGWTFGGIHYLHKSPSLCYDVKHICELPL